MFKSALSQNFWFHFPLIYYFDLQQYYGMNGACVLGKCGGGEGGWRTTGCVSMFSNETSTI